jgi:hypothetical protein
MNFATPSHHQLARALGVNTGSQSTLNSPSAVALAKADQLSTINYRLSAIRSLGHFFKLRTEHIHTSGD